MRAASCTCSPCRWLSARTGHSCPSRRRCRSSSGGSSTRSASSRAICWATPSTGIASGIASSPLCGNSRRMELRPATLDDAAAVAEVYLRSRKELVACAPLAHSDDSVRRYIRQRLIPMGQTTVAVVAGEVVGFMAVSRTDGASWITQLYLHPAWVRKSIGTRLLDLARRELPPPIRLYTFQCNTSARAFYEHHGFAAIAFGDGTGNEEKCPDVLYEWRPERA